VQEIGMELNGLPSLTQALLITAALGTALASGQQGQPTPSNKYAPPYYIDCGQQPPYKSRSARSRVLSSPDGKGEAYAEAKARLGLQGACTNTSAVFVRQSGGAFELVFFQAPIEEPTGEDFGNGVKLIDWSKDGAMLLFDVLRWNYASDAGPFDDLWIYHATDGALQKVPFDRISRTFGAGCNISFEPLGFSAAGEVVMRFSAQQGHDVDGEISLPRCDEKRVAWLFDPGSNRLTQASYSYSVQKWGTIR
jgi:hypothetical protein